ncbi:MAG: ATP-binding protein [Methanolobus sp.]|nr:ATP-binding protein [Methanolobus sp.]
MTKHLLIQCDMTLAIGSAASPLEVSHILLHHALRLDEIDMGAVFLVDENEGKMTLAASKWQMEGEPEICGEIKLSTAILSLFESENHNFVCPVRNSLFKGLLPYEKLASVFVIPVKDKGKTIVVLILGSCRFSELSDEACIVLETITTCISHALSRSKGWKELKDMKTFGKLHSEISTRFIGLDYEKVDEHIDHTLAKIGEVTGADKVSIFMSDCNKENFFLKHQWCTENASRGNEYFDNCEINTDSWLVKQLLKRKQLLIEDVRELPAEADFEKEIFTKTNTVSLAIVPLQYREKVTGCLFLSSSEKMGWPGGYMDILRLMGDVFVNALEHKRKEIETRGNELKYRTIFENIHDVYFETEMDGRIITMSPSAKEHLGFELEELIGHEASGFYVLPQERTSLLEKLKREGSVNNYVLRLKTKDNEVIYASVNAHAIPGSDDMPEKIAGIARDVTELKKIEKMQVEAKLLLENAACVKKDFVSTINHELRTPLSLIMGFSDVLLNHLKEPLSRTQEKYVTNINTAAVKLFDLITSLIQICEIENGKMEIEKSEFSLPLLIEDIQQISTPFANKKDINMEFNIDHSTKTICSDRSKLKLILLNLINNAIKFTPEKGTVSITIKKSKDDHLHFTVKDNGIGIPEENQKKLFHPFVQLEPALTRTREGTGLGLALAKEFIEMQGGRIWVTSKPGVGSTFEFILPMASGNSQIPPSECHEVSDR